MKVRYSAVVLDLASHRRLLSLFGVKEGWNPYAHHMTIVFGKGLPDHLKGDLGKVVDLTVTHVGRSDKAHAVRVKGYHSKNEVPHVTLSVNTNNGGKPVDSNSIKEWVEVQGGPVLKGKVEEVR